MINTIAHPVELYKTRTWLLRTEWRWRIKSNNGNIICASSEGYYNKKDCIANIASTSASLAEFITETEGGINFAKAKVTLNRQVNE